MSQTLFEKLQLEDEKNLLIQGLPSTIEKQFSKLSFSKNVTPLLKTRKIDFALVFALNSNQLYKILSEVCPALHASGKLWIAYPKATSKIAKVKRIHPNGNTSTLVVIATAENNWDALARIAEERARREKLMGVGWGVGSGSGSRDSDTKTVETPTPYTGSRSGDSDARAVDTPTPHSPQPTPLLLLAADQFLIDRSPDVETIIAGYHWFTDWGRDTMIALPGLCLATGRFGDAKHILRRWLAAASKGMIPNRFPDGTNEPEFNSVDAGLWLFVAIWRYREATGDDEFVRDEALPVLRDAIDWLVRGTRFNIHVDLDGLLYAGADGVALTWMDAIVDGEAVTPRRGKPVEINALWYNALRIVADLAGDALLAARADAVREAFEAAFWNRDSQCCFDVVNPNDASIRPNQIFAIALPFPLFNDARAEEILRVCEAKLLTPVGLRTLAPGRPALPGPAHRRSAFSGHRLPSGHSLAVASGAVHRRPAAPPWRCRPGGRNHTRREHDLPSRRSRHRDDRGDLRRRCPAHAQRLHRPGLERGGVAARDRAARTLLRNRLTAERRRLE